MPAVNKKGTQWRNLLFGQLIALLLASQNSASFTLEYGLGKTFPFFIMFLAYCLLSLHLTQLPASNDSLFDAKYNVPFTNLKLKAPMWSYLCLSILDVGPSYMTLLAFQYTSLTSTTLLASLTIPSTMLTCTLLLGKRYKTHHYLGVATCLIGVSLTLWADLDQTKARSTTITQSSHPHSYFGDLLAIGAAICYGIADAAGEYWTKYVDRVEYLGMLGLFGSTFTLILFLWTEGNEVAALFLKIDSSFIPVVAAILWYLASLVTYYISATLFYLTSDATLLILSLQSSNLWTILLSVVAYHEFPPPLFYIAVLLVGGGVLVYESCGKEPFEALQQEKPDPRNRVHYHSVDV